MATAKKTRVKKPRIPKTWLDASAFEILTHRIPGSWGVNSMFAAACIARNGHPAPDTSFVGFTPNLRMMVVYYVDPVSGNTECLKRYARKGSCFHIPAPLAGTTRTIVMPRSVLLAHLHNILAQSTATKP